MHTEVNYTSYNLDHLGLIAGMVDEWGLTELIDTVVEQDHEQRQISVGLCVKAMILNGLGFVNWALYLMLHFFKDKPVERLLGKGVQAEHLNDDPLGRALDAIYASGNAVGSIGGAVSQAPGSFLPNWPYRQHQLSCRWALQQRPGCIGTRHSYHSGLSLDHRPDLNQVVLQLISEQQAGVPLWMKALSGNSNDQESFRHTLNTHMEQLRNGASLSLIVADSALYTAKTRKTLAIFPGLPVLPKR